MVFGDPKAKAELRKLLADTRSDIEARKVALQTLVTVRDADAYPIVVSLLQETNLASPAARGLGAFDDPRTAGILLDAYPKLDKDARQDALLTLSSRTLPAQKLLDAIKAERSAAHGLECGHRPAVAGSQEPGDRPMDPGRLGRGSLHS